MGNIVAIASVVLALITAGCIAYIAWEITADSHGEKSSGNKPPGDQPPGGNSN